MATMAEHMSSIVANANRVTDFTLVESDKNKYGNQNARECFFQCAYDFADDGGAVGTVDLGLTIPAGTIITGGVIDVITAGTTSASGTIEVGYTGATAAIMAQTAAASVTGLLDTVPTAKTGASTFIKFTADTKIFATIATGALTAGAFCIYLTGIQGNVES
ncbi:hypothetical protein EOL73_00060 [Candidatus Saccharibacteria bacterium]|nr:hypothetical protein [Candidatus Saccharibacteria bacterium]